MLRVTIPGKPVPKDRPRFTNTGNIWSRSSEHEAQVALLFARYRGLFPTGNVATRMLFLTNPKQRADSDNLEKLVLDAMEKAGVYANDRQVNDSAKHRYTVDYGQEQSVVWVGRPGEHFDEYDGAVREAIARAS